MTVVKTPPPPQPPQPRLCPSQLEMIYPSHRFCNKCLAALHLDCGAPTLPRTQSPQARSPPQQPQVPPTPRHAPRAISPNSLGASETGPHTGHSFGSVPGASHVSRKQKVVRKACNLVWPAAWVCLRSCKPARLPCILRYPPPPLGSTHDLQLTRQPQLPRLPWNPFRDSTPSGTRGYPTSPTSP